MKKFYVSPEAEIEKFNVPSAIFTTSSDELAPGVAGGGGNDFGDMDDDF